jgi:copper chaperone
MKKVIVVEGMDNLQMGSAVARILEGISGVDKVKLALEEESIIVEYDRGALTEDELCEAINEEGFEVVEIFDD